MANKSQSVKVCRSAVSGRFVTPKYAASHPKTTVTEHRQKTK